MDKDTDPVDEPEQDQEEAADPAGKLDYGDQGRDQGEQPDDGGGSLSGEGSTAAEPSMPQEDDTAPGVPEGTVVDLDLAEKRPRQGRVPRSTEGSLTGAMLSDLATKIAAIGPQIKIKVARLDPPDFEPGESDWITIPGSPPNTYDIEKAVRDRFGGGAFQVRISNLDLQEPRTDVVRIQLHGDPRATTYQGKRWLLREHLSLPSDHPASGASPVGGTNELLGYFLQQQFADVQKDKERLDKREVGEMSAAAQMVQALSANQGRRVDMSWLAPMVSAFSAVALEILRSSKEARASDEKQREDRMDRMMDLIRETAKAPVSQPQEIVSAMQTILALTQKRAETEMAMLARNQEKIFDVAIKQMRDSGREEDASLLGALAHAVKERGGDLLATLPNLLTGMMRRPPVSPMAMQYPAPARPAALPVRPPALPPAPMLPASPPVPGSMSEAGVPMAPETTSVPDEQGAAGDEVSERASGRPDPKEVAARLLSGAMTDWLHTLNVFIHMKPDPDAAWVANCGGQTFSVIFGLAPEVFRQRVAQTDLAIPSIIRTAPWVEGSGVAEAEKIASDVDSVLIADEEACKWLAGLLLIGPWTEDEDEDESEEELDT